MLDPITVGLVVLEAVWLYLALCWTLNGTVGNAPPEVGTVGVLSLTIWTVVWL